MGSTPNVPDEVGLKQGRESVFLTSLQVKVLLPAQH